jgi:hypothetical protein
MHASPDAMCGDGGIEGGCVADIAFDERAPAHKIAMARTQIVERHRSMACKRQSTAHMRTYEARPARDEHARLAVAAHIAFA